MSPSRPCRSEIHRTEVTSAKKTGGGLYPQAFDLVPPEGSAAQYTVGPSSTLRGQRDGRSFFVHIAEVIVSTTMSTVSAGLVFNKE
jgi:large exoprotein involved in heme utilization and adhesion